MRTLFKARGQVSILVAIIFQVLFIFFAMVINVGLLVHDKINLQNSVDIAAYYGAMKQAEVLNAMGQVNYQIRQAWKIFNWRLWALSNAGRISALNGGTFSQAEQPVAYSDNYTEGPIVCLSNELWYDYKIKGKHGNLCYSAHFTVPQLKPITLLPAQSIPLFSSFLSQYVSQSQTNANLFTSDFNGGGSTNYAMAMKILSNYKANAAKRRAAMQALQNLLIGQNLTDLSGNSVQTTVQNVLLKNLTLPNKNSVQFKFQNSLTQQPFLVPIEVRAFVKYEDLVSTGSGNVQDVVTPPAEGSTSFSTEQAQVFFGPDYMQSGADPSAAEFAQESDPLHTMNSLVGFEKNPWVLAYVSVSATTNPTMLFSPFSGGQTVQLTAKAYAMPFGGRIGPWYYDSWSPNSGYSSGGNKVDKLLPPRMNENYDGGTFSPAPNYSRFPGDNLGMRSQLADTILVSQLYGLPQNELPHFAGDDYANLSFSPTDPNLDSVVTSSAGTNFPLRQAEIAAAAPDLFDALYYPIQTRFVTDFGQPNVGGTNLFATICNGGCYDVGTSYQAGQPNPQQVLDEVGVANSAYQGKGFWIVNNADNLNTGWTQEATDDYGGTSHPPTKVGLPQGGTNGGGRVGYSVKLVSLHFLTNPNLPFGGSSGGSGPIVNPPSQ